MRVRGSAKQSIAKQTAAPAKRINSYSTLLYKGAQAYESSTATAFTVDLLYIMRCCHRRGRSEQGQHIADPDKARG